MTDKLVDNFSSREGFIPQLIVIHVGEGNRAQIFGRARKEEKLGAFVNEQKSSHILVNEDGSTWRFVKDEDSAWTQGYVKNPKSSAVIEFEKKYPDNNLNQICLSIENEGYAYKDITEEAYRSNAKQVREWCDKFSIPCDNQHVIPHNWIRNDKSCPGKISVQKIIDLANSLKESDREATPEEYAYYKGIIMNLLQQIVDMMKKQLNIK